jgi:hypothetical protein
MRPRWFVKRRDLIGHHPVSTTRSLTNGRVTRGVQRYSAWHSAWCSIGFNVCCTPFDATTATVVGTMYNRTENSVRVVSGLRVKQTCAQHQDSWKAFSRGQGDVSVSLCSLRSCLIPPICIIASAWSRITLPQGEIGVRGHCQMGKVETGCPAL